MPHTRPEMVSEIFAGRFSTIQRPVYECHSANILNSKLWSTDDVVLLGTRCLKVSIPDISRENIEAVQSCIRERNAHTLSG